MKTTAVKKPRVGLAVILMNNEKVLLGKRKNNPGVGEWSFPSKHLNLYENFKPCVTRIINEETGLERRGVKLIDDYPVAVTNDLFLDNDKHNVTLFMRARYLLGDVRIMEEDKYERWLWFEWDELPNGLFLPVKNLINQGYNPFA